MNQETQIKTNAYDELVHLATECKSSRSDTVKDAKRLFPHFTDTARFDPVVDSYVIEQFCFVRGMGMNVQESAAYAEVSELIMTKALRGEGLSLERFIELIKADRVAVARTKKSVLFALLAASDSGNVTASKELLEKVWPKDYGSKALVDYGEEEDEIFGFEVSVRKK